MQAFPCQECAQRFETERALSTHVKYTHGPGEDADPTRELMKEVLLNAGIPEQSEVHTSETIQLCPFLAIHKPKDLNNLEGKEMKYNRNGYRKVRVLFDTGAGESVAPPGEFTEFPIRESEGSRKGWFYEAANGEGIDNEGEQVVKTTTNEFQSRACVFQVAKVSKPLLSAAQVTKAGFLAVLDGPGNSSYLFHKKSGAKTKLNIENGVYCLDLWIKDPKSSF